VLCQAKHIYCYDILCLAIRGVVVGQSLGVGLFVSVGDPSLGLPYFCFETANSVIPMYPCFPGKNVFHSAIYIQSTVLSALLEDMPQ